ncbi:unnamed protein product [Cuscuta europaea]|uniref:Uncharacterized protein n=1 Tax=Cuscuta europaea TaxID=41803 RepID=A0A9P1DX15_CUSEU|nr:unnamed protein product [Cuscuta europaea]
MGSKIKFPITIIISSSSFVIIIFIIIIRNTMYESLHKTLIIFNLLVFVPFFKLPLRWGSDIVSMSIERKEFFKRRSDIGAAIDRPLSVFLVLAYSGVLYTFLFQRLCMTLSIIPF